MSTDRRWAFEREDEDERLARVLDEEARDQLGLEEADRLLERADAPREGS